MYYIELHHAQVGIHIDSCLLEKGKTSNTIMYWNKEHINFWTVGYVHPDNVGIFSTSDLDTVSVPPATWNVDLSENIIKPFFHEDNIMIIANEYPFSETLTLYAIIKLQLLH